MVGLLLAAGVGLHAYGQPVHWPGFLAMTFFYGLVFWLGAWAGSKGDDEEADAEDLMLAGRALPLWVSVFTMGATWVGGGYINGTAEYAYSSGLVWVQAPWGYALSLVVGGLVFARPMRRRGYTTMLDPFERRFGRRMAALCYLPALTGELFWTAAILTALGTTFGTVLGLGTTPAILLSAAVAVAYTALGGLWAVAFTDVLQMILLLVGLWLVVPQALEHSGGLSAAWAKYTAAKGGLSTMIPPWGGWRDPAWGGLWFQWWDSAMLLIFGGIPWHVYFQRVLSAKNENTAAGLSILAAGVCILAAVPAVLVGVAAFAAPWEAMDLAPPPDAARTLPWVVRYLTGPITATIGLGAVAAAVMSSVDSSILSASSMAAWNVYRPLVKPEASSQELARCIQRFVWAAGGAATLLALKVQSVYDLWFLCSDFVYTVLFPQLVAVLFDKKANTPGAMAGFIVSVALRFGSGVPALGLSPWIPWPMPAELGGPANFPFRTATMVLALGTIVVVSRLTQGMAPAIPLDETDAEDAAA
jgi:high affinity choline transporter 7